MNKLEYIENAISEGFLNKLKWYFAMFSVCVDENNYVLIKDNKVYYKYGGELHETGTPVGEPIMNIKDKIKITKGFLPNVDKDIETSVGLLIANKIRLSDNFGATIPYINKMFTDKDIEELLPSFLTSGKISIDSYIKYVDSASLLLPLNTILTHSGSVKTITPPPNMVEEKTKLKKEFKKKYGDNWSDDATLVVKFTKKIEEIDKEYLKDDPAYGKVLSGKVTGNSRPRLYGVFGRESGFDETGDTGTFIENSLSEGYPEDKKSLSVLFNSGRAGSYLRGSETKEGGVLAKYILRPTSSITLVSGDCGTKEGIKITMTKDLVNRYQGSYILEDNKTIYVDDFNPYIGKKIIIRSPMYCKQKGEKFCLKCVNKAMEQHHTGIPLLVIEAAGIILNAKMKAMHKATKSFTYINIKDTII